MKVERDIIWQFGVNPMALIPISRVQEGIQLPAVVLMDALGIGIGG